MHYDEQEKPVVTAEENELIPTKRDKREAARRMIRNRVQNASVMNAVFLPAKPKPSIYDDGEKIVSVYARVSTDNPEQVTSIENQTRYYTEKIEKHPNWRMYKLYSDEGKSGTSMKQRKEFQQMMEDAQQQKMDLILCASVSRFARNISDCLTQIRLLRTMHPAHPIGVFFETEQIYTLNPDSEQNLTVHAMLADWESANKSRRMVLSYDQRICTGQYPVADLLGYRHTKSGELIMEPEEAITVRFIFLALAYGMSAEMVAQILTQKERKTLKGRVDWNASMVRNIIGNERRWGDLSARKTIVIDHISRKTVKNNEMRDAAYVKEHHEGIVTPELAKVAKYMLSCGCYLENGLPTLQVIDIGILKGFVSISPKWTAVDNATFLSICKAVYTDDEIESMEREAKILAGNTHGNVLSMQFHGYEVPRGVYFMTGRSPTLTLAAKRIQFSKACANKLGIVNCVGFRAIEVLYHPLMQAIAIRPCDEDNPNAIRMFTDGGAYVGNIAARAFASAIYERMDWIQRYNFKFRGIYRKRAGAKMMLFFLDEPQILAGKKAKDVSDEYEHIRYISYRNSNEDHPEDKVWLRAYPYEWSEYDMGLSYALGKKRDALADALTVEDIYRLGVDCVNPMIGVIPDREMIYNEIDSLINRM